MHDVQSETDSRNIPINKVGVKNLEYPIALSDKTHKLQHTIAKFNLFVNLPHQFRGTHMSRFIEILNKYRREIAVRNIGDILREMKTRLDAEAAHLEIEFPYFIEKEAPVTGAKSQMGYHCRFVGDFTDKIRIHIGAKIPISTVCPCSREISDFGAHNQRATINVLARLKGFLWLEDLISIVETSGSSQVYSLLKREDEKAVTEAAYNNPAFVEDVVRTVAQKLNAIKTISGYSIEVESYESIHNHDAYAFIEKK
ncbi:GTP cyclohydrolase I FolE2 [bacterium]|nr:GTP cyclohydrolase I FolE2 [bacterium]